MAVAVIGSGVAGVSVACALVARGKTVTILDVGETLDDSRRAIIDKLKYLPVAEWSDEDAALINREGEAEVGDLPSKLHFGSDYIYAYDRSFALTNASNAPFPTFAKGGFSNVWGAAVLPPDACDMADWPIRRSSMEPYFRRAAALLPICGGDGTLSRSFPTYRDTLGDLDPGPQGRLLLEDLQRAEPQLLKDQTLYGRARLAVHTAPAEGDVMPCNGCGLCSTGCVRGSIFGTVPILEGMIRRKQIEYRAGIYIDHIAESDNGAVVEGVDLQSNERYSASYEALFVAAGPLNSTRLLLRSRRLYDCVVTLREAQKFVIPMLRRRAAATTIEQPSATLASAFIETKVPALSDHWIHVQVASMNRTIVAGSGLPGASHSAGYRLWSPLLRRVMAAWCGMHSDHSSKVEVCLRRGEGAQPDRLEIGSQISPTARAAAGMVAKDLWRKGRLFNTLFCYWMTRFASPGRATHCGSSFPMKRRPDQMLDSDSYGRPFGWSRIFVVDSSVLPSIPGTTTAFPVMANAFRIGTEAPIA